MTEHHKFWRKRVVNNSRRYTHNNNFKTEINHTRERHR